MKFSKVGDSEGGDFIRLKDGESVQGVLRGEPFEFHQHWKGQTTVRCIGRDTCTECAAGNKPAFRFKLNMITKEDGKLAVKVLENGWKLYQALADLNAGGWELEKNFIRITRTGSGKNNTVYSAVPVPGGVPPETLARINDLEIKRFTEADAREPGQDEDDVPSQW